MLLWFGSVKINLSCCHHSVKAGADFISCLNVSPVFCIYTMKSLNQTLLGAQVWSSCCRAASSWTEITSPPEASISFSSSASLSTLTVNSDTDVLFLVSRHLRSRSNLRRTADTRNKRKMCEAGMLHAENKRLLLWVCNIIPCHYYTLPPQKTNTKLKLKTQMKSVRVRGSRALSAGGEMTSWSVDKYTAGIKK